MQESDRPDRTDGEAAPVAAELSALVDYAEGSVVSRTLVKRSGGTLTLFAFDAGQGLSEHTAPFDAFVLIVDGRAELTIGGKLHALATGESIVMPANVPHAVQAPERMKMFLAMIRDRG